MIRVTIADDHPIVLAGIRTLLASDQEMEVVGEAVAGEDALALIEREQPDVAILDVSLPGLDCTAVTRRASASFPGTRILILTVHDDRAFVQTLLLAGARGYILKRSAAEDLLRAVRAVAGGRIYLDPDITEAIVGAALPGSGGLAAPDRPSGREREVLRLTARGSSNKEIANSLGISVKTVETYKARACEKIGLSGRAEILRYAATQGWLDDLVGR